DFIPYTGCGFGTLFFVEVSIPMEIRVGTLEGCLAEPFEPSGVPFLQVFRRSVHVDRIVEEIRYEYAWAAVLSFYIYLEHIDAFYDQDVGLRHPMQFIRNNVVYQVGVYRC